MSIEFTAGGPRTVCAGAYITRLPRVSLSFSGTLGGILEKYTDREAEDTRS